MHTVLSLYSLLEEIETAGLSVRQVCLAAGIDPSLVSRWKTGRTEPRISSLARLEAGLRILQRTAL
jgi:transcriptional regulator with XRE-family HTH domain